MTKSICFPVKKSCSTKGKPASWSVAERMGEKSLHGDVYQACCKANCNHVMKYLSYSKKYKGRLLNTRKDFKKEVDIMTYASDHEFGPTILDSWECFNSKGKATGGVIIMEVMEITLYKYIKEIKTNPRLREGLKRILECSINTINKMHESNVFHADLHMNNIMINNPYGKNPRCRIIDFGRSSYGVTQDRIDRDYFKLANYIQSYDSELYDQVFENTASSTPLTAVSSA